MVVHRSCAPPCPPVPSRQLRLKIRPLATALDDGSGHRLRGVVLDHAARRRRVRGRPGVEDDRPRSLLIATSVTRGRFADAGNLVAQHVAAGRELGGRARRRRARGQAPHSAQAGSDLAGYRLRSAGRVCFIGPVAVRVEVLGPVLGPPESFQSQALGAVFAVLSGPAGRLQVRRARDHPALVVEQPLSALHPFCEPRGPVSHTSHRRGDSLITGTRIAALEEVGVVQCAAGSDGSSLSGPRPPRTMVVTGEIVDDPAQRSPDPNPPHPHRPGRPVTRSYSRRSPPLSTVPNAAAEPGADTMKPSRPGRQKPQPPALHRTASPPGAPSRRAADRGAPGRSSCAPGGGDLALAG